MTVKHDCSEKAYHSLGNWGQWDPCSRKATVERDGKWYCWQHDPERVEADKKKRRAAWAAKADRQADVWERRARNARLGPLVTEELAAMLARLGDFAICSRQGEKHDYQHWFDEPCSDDPGRALALAARIREALEGDDA